MAPAQTQKSFRPAAVVLAAVLSGALLGAGANAGEATVRPDRVKRIDAAKARFQRAASGLGELKRSAGRPLTDPDSLIVRYRRGVTDAQAKDAIGDAGVRRARSVASLGFDVVSTKGESRSDAASRLRRDPRVASVETNHLRYAADDPNDDLYPSQTHLFNSRLPAAWDVTHGSATIDIAILDTGVDLDHPDLASRLVVVPGSDVVNGDSLPDDDEGGPNGTGHGTMVAGVAAAKTDNVIGVAGAAFNARIMPIKVLDANGEGNDADIAAGIALATANGAEIINMSFGAPGSTPTLDGAVANAVAAGVTVVAAAGNEATSVPDFPAASDGVISVGAADEFGDLAFFSNRGPTIDVVAQGTNVNTTARGLGAAEEYAMGSGTSFSAPLVAGVAALVRAVNPTFTREQVEARMRSSAIDRGPDGIDDYYGWGLVDAYAAVGGRTAASPPISSDALEPTDVPDRAVAIDTGASATISPEGDVDWFSATATGVGRLTITVDPTTDSSGGLGAQTLDAEITGWSSTLQLLGTSADGLPDATVTLDTPVTAGTYFFRVANRASTRSPGPPSTPDPYDVTASFSSTPLVGTPGEQLWVRLVTPADFATGVATAAHPTVKFARDLNAPSVTTATVRLVDAQTQANVPTSVSYDAPTRTATITPTAALSAGRPYLVEVSGVSDASAAVMDEPYVSRFTTAAPAAAPDLRSDFNGDGRDDVVVASPTEDIGIKKDAGIVHVMYGSATGAKAVGSQMWNQDTPGVHGLAEAGDRFGDAVATGDLNKDGYDDLVVSASREDLGVFKDAGAVHVILGSAGGLRAAGNQIWTQDSPSIPDPAESGDRFGAALAVGDFDNSAGDDVAIGSPGESIGSQPGAGVVHVLRGSAAGLTGTGVAMWTQNSPGIEFFAEAGDGFGSALAAGDFQGDTHDDLAIGAPSDDVVTFNEGTVTLMHGSILGLRPAVLIADVIDPDVPEAGDRFGASLAIGDLGGFAPADPYEDLVIGVPGQNIGAASRAGRVDVIYSDHTDPWFAVSSVDQSSFGLGSAESGAGFGSAVAARRMGTAGVLAVGVPFDDLGSRSNAGAVHVLRGGETNVPIGDLVGGLEAFTQDTPDMPGGSEAGDLFGASVSLGDVDGDGNIDLVAGSSEEGVGTQVAAGAVHVVRRVAIPSWTAAVYTQDTPGIESIAESGDRFGSFVAG
jgi:subtilisin family serine protease